MSVIVAKNQARCSTGAPTVTLDCYPAISVQKLVPFTTTQVIDSASVLEYRAVKWLVTMITGTASRVRSFEVYATHQNGANPTNNKYAILGDSFAHNVFVSIVAGQLILNVANNDIEDIIVYATRIGIPLTSSTPIVTNTVQIGSINTAIRAGSTGVLDFIPALSDGAIATKWQVAMKASDGSHTAFQVFVKALSGIQAVQYGLIGNPAITSNVIITPITGYGFELSLQNTSLVDLTIDATRIPVYLSSSAANCAIPSNKVKLWAPRFIIVAPGTTKVADIASFSDVSAVKWLFSATDVTTLRTMGSEISSTLDSNTSATHVMYGLIGYYHNINIITNIISDKQTLEITNNQTNPIIVNLLRVPVFS
jgi:hypothetical protein